VAGAPHAVTAALAAAAGRRERAKVLRDAPIGWRNNASQDQEVTFSELTVGYRFDRSGRLAALHVDGVPYADAVLHAATGEEVDLALDGRRVRYRVRTGAAGSVYVNSPEGQASLRRHPRFAAPEEHLPAGSLASPMPGAVARVMAAQGDRVARGQPLLVIEAMKMEHEIVAPSEGVLSELLVAVGTQVQAGTMLAVVADAEREERSA
jgi:propionyl-CoA carboxylase alpha chain